MKQDETVSSAQPKTDPARFRENRWVLGIALSLLVSIPVSALSLLAYDHYLAPKIRVIDFKDFLEQQRKLFLSGAIDEKTLQDNLAGLQDKIHSQPSNIIIFEKGAVLNDAKTIAD